MIADDSGFTEASRSISLEFFVAIEIVESVRSVATERGHSCPRHDGGWKTPTPFASLVLILIVIIILILIHAGQRITITIKIKIKTEGEDNAQR